MSKYQYFSLGNNIYKPWISVTLGYKKTSRITSPSIALIDSGADVCLCSKDIGIWLGIPFDKKSRVTLIAANKTKFQTIKETITLYACGKKYECPFYFSDSLPPVTPIILGQKGFFDHFKITFDLPNKEITIL